eukprot:Lankesteria_metandrocarpae@DN3952_c0_g1_i1.p2
MSFMVDCCGDAAYQVRFQVLELWQTALGVSKLQEAIGKQLPRLLPRLVENTRYTYWDFMQMDSAQLSDDTGNVAEGEDTSDLRPRFHQSQHICPEDQDEDDSGDSKRLWGATWTVRKGAALALDLISDWYASEDVLPHVLPIIETRLLDSDWQLRESGVLSLGAISDGCIDTLSPYLSNVITVLLGLFDDSKPLLRSISTWCVCRFTSWACLPENRDTYLKLLVHKVLGLALDPNKRVQEAAVSSFAAVEEQAQQLLLPYLDLICETFASAFTFYKPANLALLYDVVGTLADSLGPQLNQPVVTQKLLPPVFEKWRTVPESDPSSLALFQCVTCLSAAFKQDFAPFAIPVVERCVQVLQHFFSLVGDWEAYEAVVSAQGGVQVGDGDKLQSPKESLNRGLLDVTLDLLTSLTDSLEAEITKCFDDPRWNFLPYLDRCCVEPCLRPHPATGVSTFALVGMVARVASPHLIPYLSNILPALVSGVSHRSLSLANNAAWSVGVLAVKCDPVVLQPVSTHLMERLSGIIQLQSRPHSFLRTSCYTIGRLGLACPTQCALFLPQMLRQWCGIMAPTRNNDEKLLAIRGILVTIDHSWQTAQDNIAPLLLLIASLYPQNHQPGTPSTTGRPSSQPAMNAVSNPSDSGGGGCNNSRTAAGIPVVADNSYPGPPAELVPLSHRDGGSSDGGMVGVFAVPPELEVMLRNLLQFLESSAAEKWSMAWLQLPPEVQHKLKSRMTVVPAASMSASPHFRPASAA